MRNRLKDYGRDFSSLDELLKDIQKRQETLLDSDELSLTAGLKGELKEGGEAILKALIYDKQAKRKPLCELMPSLDNYLSMLRDFDGAIKTIKDPAVVNSFKCLEYIFTLDVMSLAGGTRGFSDEQMKYREDFFNKRNALPKDNIFRRAFIETYIDEEVFNRFYLEKEKEAGRYETDDEGENYTPEKALEWDAHYNDLCLEYGEAQYKRAYNDPTEFYPTMTEKDRLYNKNENNFTRQALKELEEITRLENEKQN